MYLTLMKSLSVFDYVDRIIFPHTETHHDDSSVVVSN